MRVLHVTDRLPAEPRGGLDRHVTDLDKALRARGVDSSIEALADAVDDGEGGLRRAISNQPLLDRFRATLDALRPDVVHVHSLADLSHRIPEFARKSMARVVWTHHDLYALCQRVHLHDGQGRACAGPKGGLACGPCHGGMRGLVASPVFLLRTTGFLAALRACHANLAPSRWVAAALGENGVPADQVRVVPPAVPRPERLAELPADARTIRLLFAGDLRYSKGVDLAVDAFGLLARPGITLDVLGGAPAPPAPREWDLEAHLRKIARPEVRMRGRYDGDDALLAALDGAAALVVASRVRETWGRTANLALLAGIPVVAPRTGAFPDYVEDGVNGVLYEPGDVEALRTALDRVIRDGVAMQAEVDRWPRTPDLDRCVDAVLASYQD